MEQAIYEQVFRKIEKECNTVLSFRQDYNCFWRLQRARLHDSAGSRVAGRTVLTTGEGMS